MLCFYLLAEQKLKIRREKALLPKSTSSIGNAHSNLSIQMAWKSVSANCYKIQFPFNSAKLRVRWRVLVAVFGGRGKRSAAAAERLRVLPGKVLALPSLAAAPGWCHEEIIAWGELLGFHLGICLLGFGHHLEILLRKSVQNLIISNLAKIQLFIWI